jgi:dipeptidyl aminopeptidase/acylaminoacyl peptidase
MLSALSLVRPAIVCWLTLWVVAALISSADGQMRRRLKPEDCIRVHYLAESAPTVPIRMDPMGKRVAYVIESADLSADRALTQLYVRDLSDTDPSHARLLLSEEGVAGIQWSADGKHLTCLARMNGRSSVALIDIETARIRVLARASTDIVEYSANRDASVVVFATLAPDSGTQSTARHPTAGSRAGYLIQVGSGLSETLQKRLLYVIRRRVDGKWSDPARIVIEDPFTGRHLSEFPHYDVKIYDLHLSLSPDARQLLFSYVSDSIPSEWKSDPVIAYQMRAGSPAVLTVLYNLRSAHVTVPLNSIKADSPGSWSPNSESFVIAAFPPVGSSREKRDLEASRRSVPHLHLFLVATTNGEVKEVEPSVVNPKYAVLAWKNPRSLIIESGGGSVSEVSEVGGVWKETAHLSVPFAGLSAYAPIASDGTTVVGVRQSPTEPPELFSFHRGDKSIHVITNMNAFLDSLTLASTMTLQWSTSDGGDVAGLLFLPPNYEPGKRYPLVIQAKQGNFGSFVCDGGSYHYPSVAPEPLANEGILYLERWISDSVRKSDLERPDGSGYPGQIGEVVHEMDVWENAVKMLTEKNMVDPNRIGIIGFSRGGWYAEFMLAHSSIHFRAATATDNVQYTVGDYWIERNSGVSREVAAAYGGPPFGPSLSNWLKYSTSFTLPSIRTPLLMEVMGYGVHDDVIGMIPENLAPRFELLTGLTELGKPVELYYYPDEDHLIHGPMARLRDLERNVDWYRFWLLDEERSDPEDPGQYIRWRQLRRLQETSSPRQ